MKICYVTEGDIESLATAKRATGMASPLLAAGHAVGIVMADCPGNRRRVAVECPGADVLYYSRRDALHDLRSKVALVERYSPDLIWICGLGFRNAISHLWGGSRAKILVEHSELNSSIVTRRLTRRSTDAAFEWSSLFVADGLICASRFLERLFARRARTLRRKMPILYSPYAFSPHILSARREPSQAVREICRGNRVALFMGSFNRCYGVFELVRAVALMAPRRKDLRLIMLGGDGEEGDQLKAEVERLGLKEKVLFTGYVPEEELPGYLGLADAFVSPLFDTTQDWARCPSKLFMYLPFGKPIVTCRIGEALELFGAHGCYYEPGSVEGLANALERALYDGGAGRVHLPSAEEHSWEMRSRTFLGWVDSAKLLDAHGR